MQRLLSKKSLHADIFCEAMRVVWNCFPAVGHHPLLYIMVMLLTVSNISRGYAKLGKWFE